MTTAKNAEYYKTILDGLSHLYGSGLVRDILLTIDHAPGFDLAHALNKNQIRSKVWILDKMAEVIGGEYGTIRILGGWYGVLGSMILDDPRFCVDQIISIDITPECAPIADRLNARHVAAGHFSAQVADIYDLDMPALVNGHHTLNGDGARHKQDLIICTSCEHLENLEAWYSTIPDGAVMVLQSNDYFSCEEHVNCVPDLPAFAAQTPMHQVLYEGALPMKRYTRFMRIGRK